MRYFLHRLFWTLPVMLGVLTLTANGGSTTVANFQSAFRTVTYQNTNAAAATAVREIEFAADDGTDVGFNVRNISIQDAFGGSAAFDFGIIGTRPVLSSCRTLVPQSRAG